MSLADQYAFEGANHFDPEKVMKVPQVLHIKQCRELELYVSDFISVGVGDDQVINIKQNTNQPKSTLPDEQ